MSDIAYAVHTTTCTYLLDDDGICRWTLFPGGRMAPGTDRCVGAQFVACLDLYAEGGLLGELRVGASALFARAENGRIVLLRTPPIERVEYRSPGDLAAFPDESTEVLGPDAPWAAMMGPPPVPPPGTFEDPQTPDPPTPTARLPDHVPGYDPAYAIAIAGHRPGPPGPAPEEEAEPLDIEDFLSISVSEVARTNPLYRPPPGAPPSSPWPYARAPLPPPRPPPRPSAAPPAGARPLPPIPRPPVLEGRKPAGAPAPEPSLASRPPRPPEPAPHPGVVDPGRRLR